MEVLKNLDNYKFPNDKGEVELAQVKMSENSHLSEALRSALTMDDSEPEEKCDNEGEDDGNNLVVSTCKELLDYEVQPEFFVINPLIPREAITSITADSGKGKSLFTLILAYHIAIGQTLFDKYEVEQGKVLIIDQEMSKNEIVTRFKKLVDRDIQIDYIINQKFLITDPENFSSLLLSILQNKYSVVILDTFTECHDREENDAGAMKAVNKQLLELIRITKVSVIYLHHHRKPQKGERLSQSSSRGSSEIIAKVSSHLLLDSKNYKNEYGDKVLEITVSQEKARSYLRLEGKISLKIYNDQETGRIRYDYLGLVEEKGKKIEEAKLYIMEYLQIGQSATVNDLTDKSGIGGSNIRAALKDLVSSNKLDVGRRGKEKYYFLPGDQLVTC